MLPLILLGFLVIHHLISFYHTKYGKIRQWKTNPSRKGYPKCSIELKNLLYCERRFPLCQNAAMQKKRAPAKIAISRCTCGMYELFVGTQEDSF